MKPMSEHVKYLYFFYCGIVNCPPQCFEYLEYLRRNNLLGCGEKTCIRKIVELLKQET